MSQLSRGKPAPFIDMAGKTVLIVEDEFLVADDMARYFESSGATVLGPVPTPLAAWSIVAREGPLDGAILDVNPLGVRREMVRGFERPGLLVKGSAIVRQRLAGAFHHPLDGVGCRRLRR
ncbi:response regulator [Aureimonas sp. D3]|uniref:response regulator n=1 Tax=Aureimonas sp. D3 TaxID=1638164 RepID=UPI000780D471|nr:response regulator [Aureimonas sp. D3]